MEEADYLRVPDQVMLILLKLSTYVSSVHDYLRNSFYSGRFTTYTCYNLAQTIVKEKASELAGCCVELLSATDIENEWVWLRLGRGTAVRRTVYSALFRAFGKLLMDECKSLCERGRLCWSLLECFIICWLQCDLNRSSYLESVDIDTLPVLLNCILPSLTEQDCILLLHSPKILPSHSGDYASLMLMMNCSRADIYSSLVRSMVHKDNPTQLARMRLAVSHRLFIAPLPFWIHLKGPILDYRGINEHLVPLIKKPQPVDFILSIDCLTLSLILHNQLNNYVYSEIDSSSLNQSEIDPSDVKCLIDVAVACSSLRYVSQGGYHAITVCADILPRLFHAPELMNLVEGISVNTGIELFKYCKNLGMM